MKNLLVFLYVFLFHRAAHNNHKDLFLTIWILLILESGESIWLKKGPYGYYVQLGETKKRKGIPKGFSLSDVDLSYALKLLSLPMGSDSSLSA